MPFAPSRLDFYKNASNKNLPVIDRVNMNKLNKKISEQMHLNLCKD